MELDRALLEEFEYNIDTKDPERGSIPIEILGFGEISLVFKIINDKAGEIAYKRLPIFKKQDQVESHISAYNTYNEMLQSIGIILPEYGATWVYRSQKQKDIALFCAQETISPELVGNKLLHTLSDDKILELVHLILLDFKKVWHFNANNETQLGFDGQISNFALIEDKLVYLDTSTPMYREDGKDAMDANLFLKSAPPGIRILLKLFFLKEVLDRYYNLRDVIIDLLANFYKEQREDLLPQLIELVNDTLNTELSEFNIEALTLKEIKDYYKSDKFIWVLFLNARRFHRFISTKIFRRKYPFYLPKKIKR